MKSIDKVPGLRVSLVREGGVTRNTIVDNPSKVAALVARFIPVGEEREHFLTLHLDARPCVKGVTVVSIGTLTASLVHPREVFRPAIVAGAAAVVVAHNHPSGDVSPSAEDRSITRRLRQAGELLGVPLLDHLIVAGETVYFSFKERGLI